MRMLKNETVFAISLVDKAANGKKFFLFKSKEKSPEGTVSKTMPIIKDSDKDWNVLYGIVIEPDTPDLDGDITPAEEVAKACHNTPISTLLVDKNHNLNNTGSQIVESAIAPVDFEINGSTIKKGTWYVAIKINDPEIKEAIDSGEITGLSRFGYAEAEELVKTENGNVAFTRVTKQATNMIKDLTSENKLELFSAIAKDFNTEWENFLNNDLWIRIDSLTTALYDIKYSDLTSGEKKSQMIESINQFAESISSMTFVRKSVGSESNETQEKETVEKSEQENTNIETLTNELAELKNTIKQLQSNSGNKDKDSSDILETLRKEMAEYQKKINELEKKNNELTKAILASSGVENPEINNNEKTNVAKAAKELFGFTN